MLQARFSIRLSILSIVLILIIGISSLIISTNYFSTNSILVASAKDYLSQSSGKVAEQISSYLQPLNDNALTAYCMLDNDVVNPQDQMFPRFLSSLFIDDENIVGAYWGDVYGSIYWVNREKKSVRRRE